VDQLTKIERQVARSVPLRALSDDLASFCQLYLDPCSVGFVLPNSNLALGLPLISGGSVLLARAGMLARSFDLHKLADGSLLRDFTRRS
jgi:hypothetical protein